MIETGFTFQDGDSLPIFVEKVGDSVRFFDDSEIVFHFLGRGLGDVNGGLRTRFITNAIAPYGLTLNDQNVVEIWTSQGNSADAFAKYISGLMAIIQWEHENQGIGTDTSYLVEEVAMYLAAWKRDIKIEEKPIFIGMSKTQYALDFKVGNEVIIAITPHPYSVGNALKKMVDIAGVTNIEFRVIMDDRENKEAADTQGIILTTMATVMPITKLIEVSNATETMN